MASSSAIAASKSLMVGSVDMTVQLTLVERDVNAFAGGHTRRLADDRGVVRVPAHGVAAPEHGKRAETLEPRRAATETRIAGVHPPRDRGGQAPVDRREPRAHLSEAATQVERFKLQAQLVVQTLASRECDAHAATELVRQFGGVAAAQHHAAAEPREARSGFDRSDTQLDSPHPAVDG